MVARVVHLVSPATAAGLAGWVSPDGSERHEFVSWRDLPPTVAQADLVVAHGLPALVVAQSLIADIGPGLVYRPSGSNRVRRRRWHRRLRAAWIIASDSRTGWAAAHSIGLGSDRVVVIDEDDRAAWSSVVASLLRGEPIDADLLPQEPRRRRSPWSVRRRGRPRVVRPSSDEQREVEVPGPTQDTAEPVTAEPVTAEPVTPEPVTPEPVTPEPVTAEPVPTEPVPTEPIAPASAPPEAPPSPQPIVARPRLARKLAVGAVEPTVPGQPWFRYRQLQSSDTPREPRPNGAPTATTARDGAAPKSAAAHRGEVGSPPPAEPPPADRGRAPGQPSERPRRQIEIVATAARSGMGLGVVGVVVLATVATAAHLRTTTGSPVLIPLGGLFLTLAAVRRITRNHPDEHFVGRWLLLGFIAKLLASYFRYYTLVHTYGGLGDASDYDKYGRLFSHAWLTGTAAPVLQNLKATNFIRWFTGVVYYVFGTNLVSGFFVFGLLALVGSYLWYRATVDAVPMINRRLYLGFVLFAPSIVFWPAEVGKEALMQLGLGTLALGVSFLLRHRLLTGVATCLAGGWLVWVVRPHLLSLVAVAAGAAYLAGRVRKEGGRAGLLTRPLGIIVVAFLVAFAIGQGAKFLGVNALSVSSIQSELNQETVQTSQGGSQFHNGGTSFNPVTWPADAVTVFLRPFPWEIQGSLQILASLESLVLALLIVWRFRALRLAFARSREAPFLMFCWVLTGLYAVTFSSFANFGLLVRERSLVLPALLVLLSVDPDYERTSTQPIVAPAEIVTADRPREMSALGARIASRWSSGSLDATTDRDADPE